MPLEPGTRLGHYDVTSLLGEGGMGQVWQSTDTQLNRQVALKILPDAFAADPDRLARFQREAQILASLNHPNIAAIYGIEEAEGTRALVLELVEGPTLADRIARGPIPLDEALPIAKQIAEALEAAHEAGVIHRDLKPANIKVREDGTVKVLDFGLAKALDPVQEGDPSNSPTLTAAATQMGVIMGTAAYMSPEQAWGKPVDKRADIWAFGCVLYEMLTGGRAFAGDDVSETLARVLEREPVWESLPGTMRGRLVDVTRRCLEKDPRQRMRDIGDVRLALEGAFEPEREPEELQHQRTTSPGWRHGLLLVVGSLAVASLVTGVLVSRFGEPEVSPARVGRFTITPSAGGVTIAVGGMALTPDGQRLVYTENRGATRQLYVRGRDQLEGSPIPGSEDGLFPFLSPDGDMVGFVANNRLQTVSLAGGGQRRWHKSIAPPSAAPRGGQTTRSSSRPTGAT